MLLNLEKLTDSPTIVMLQKENELEVKGYIDILPTPEGGGFRL